MTGSAPRKESSPDVVRLRLRNQRIDGAQRGTAAEIVEWLVAVQAQDFAGAKWSLGLRLKATTDGDIERAFNDGSILRTHLLRPTWHFVTPVDIRWLLALTGPRVRAANAPMDRRLNLDHAVFVRSNEAFARALEGGRHLTRGELRGDLQRAGVATEGGQRMAYLVMRAELDGVICSGPRRGKQFTYALLDERAPPPGRFDRAEALAHLSRRYFASRGPASVQDFAKWSGLTVADAGRGLQSVRQDFRSSVVDGQTYWFAAGRAAGNRSPTAHLLSVYDEYISSYKDRRAIVSQSDGARLVGQGNALTGVILIDGRIAGTWKRTLARKAVVIHPDLFRRLSRLERRAFGDAAQRYAAFHGLPVSLA